MIKQPTTEAQRDRATHPDGLDSRPIDGELGIPSVAARDRQRMSWKGPVAVVGALLMLLAMSGMAIHRYFSGTGESDTSSRRASDRPAIATTEPRRLDLSRPPASTATATTGTRIPAIVPTEDELADPIGIHRNQPVTGNGQRTSPPEDAPVMLLPVRPSALRQSQDEDTEASTPSDPLDQTRRSLRTYQRQLQGLLDNLATPASAPPSRPAPPTDASGTPTEPAADGVQRSGPNALLGGSLPISKTPSATARWNGDRSLTLPKGTAFTCALETKVVSVTAGLVGCLVQRNVYSEDGRVLLVERGSHMDGEYRTTSIKPGTIRIPVVWTRIRTPTGAVVDIDSPGTGPLGESGIDGWIDNRWPERIGAALLLSLIDDSVQLATSERSGAGTSGGAVVLPSTTRTGSKLAEKVLDSTINIPPVILRNQGGIVGIYVARDVDFSSVYELRAAR